MVIFVSIPKYSKCLCDRWWLKFFKYSFISNSLGHNKTPQCIYVYIVTQEKGMQQAGMLQSV